MKKRGKRASKFVYWTPRILSIIFIVFLALFSLDVFGMGLTFWGTIGALLMHNIPAFILLAVTIISWKHEIVGGIAFILAGITYIILLARNSFEWYMLAWAAQISGVSFFIGILYLINWYKKRK